MITCRVIQSGFSDAATNMALDEAIFLSHKKDTFTPTLRLYGWKTPSFSIGHSQDPQKILDLEICHNEGVDFVRRPTGGGVIFHDHELTYSLVLAQSDLGLSCRIKESFEKLTSFLILAYQTLGGDACFAKDRSQALFNYPEIADFCFSRKEEYDILVNGRKLGGNAQKRKKDIILQHGSIPLSFNKMKAARFFKDSGSVESIEITSVRDFSAREMDFDRLSDVLIKAFSLHFKTILDFGGLTDEEEILAADLKSSKYTNPEWNYNGNTREALVA